MTTYLTRVTASSFGFLIVTGVVEAFSLGISDNKRLELTLLSLLVKFVVETTTCDLLGTATWC